MCFLSSVHLRVEEKITLTCGRDGGLQNMEVIGMVTLRVTDDKNGRIRLIINNNDNKGLQLQVGPIYTYSKHMVETFVCYTSFKMLCQFWEHFGRKAEYNLLNFSNSSDICIEINLLMRCPRLHFSKIIFNKYIVFEICQSSRALGRNWQLLLSVVLQMTPQSQRQCKQHGYS